MEKQSIQPIGHPIQVVSRRTGLTTDRIRAWERRYKVVIPRRTETGRRLYSDDDIGKLLLVQRALAGGRRIGEVAGLGNDQIRALLKDDAALTRIEMATRPKAANPLSEYLDSVHNLNPEALQASLSRAAARLGGEAFISQVVGPLMREIGELWSQGMLDPYLEHCSTAIVRKSLQEMLFAAPGKEGAPVLVVATPSGQLHEIGALMAGALASVRGWRVLYLGVDLPAEDIASAARRSNARAVALSVIYPGNDPKVQAELDKLALLLHGKSLLIVGGAAAKSYSDSLLRSGAALFEDTDTFLDSLTRLLTNP